MKKPLPYIVLIFSLFCWSKYHEWGVFELDLYPIIGIHIALIGMTLASIYKIYKQWK